MLSVDKCLGFSELPAVSLGKGRGERGKKKSGEDGCEGGRGKLAQCMGDIIDRPHPEQPAAFSLLTAVPDFPPSPVRTEQTASLKPRARSNGDLDILS